MKFKKFLTVMFLSTLLAFSGSTFASAEENVGVTEVAPGQPDTSGEITPYSTTYPKSVWNLSTQGKYNFSGAANNQKLYTNYLFTGKKHASLYIENTSSTYSITAKFRQKKTLLDSTVYTVTLKPGQWVSRALTLDQSAHYYLEVAAPSKFKGYIQ